MISHGNNLKVFFGNSNPHLARNICKLLNVQPGNAQVSAFSDKETFVSLNETVRGSDVFVLQSTCTPGNDYLMEMLILIDALKRASAERITAVIPYFGYARQDRSPPSWLPI